jgi:hypothetical protein
MARNVLLLSATIQPPAGMPVLTRTDPSLRLNDYIQSIDFYVQFLGKCFDAIVLAENSEADLTSLRERVAAANAEDRVELLSFNGLDYPPAYGRGYGEYKLVDYAMANSAFLRRDDDLTVWKCTGRYRLINIEQMVRRRPASFDLYCNMRNHPIYLCDLFFLAWNLKGYETAIKGAYTKLRNDQPSGFVFEETLFRHWIEGLRREIKIVPRFRHVPRINGIRGWNNAPYEESPWDRKILIRRLALTFLPWLWI